MSYIDSKNTELEKAQVSEAIARMRKLKLHPNTINEFKKDGKLNKSENLHVGSPRGERYPFLYWLKKEEEQMVREWEKETGSVVYHVIENQMEFGHCYSHLYVSKYQEEWEMDNEMLERNLPFVYVENKDFEWCSEFGSIEIKPVAGGVLRLS